MERSNDEMRTWIEDVKKWKESGLSQRKWCSENKITLSSFRYRNGKVKEYMAANGGKGSEIPSNLSLVKIAESERLIGDELEIKAKGIKVIVTTEAKPVLVKAIIEEILNA